MPRRLFFIESAPTRPVETQNLASRYIRLCNDKKRRKILRLYIFNLMGLKSLLFFGLRDIDVHDGSGLKQIAVQVGHLLVEGGIVKVFLEVLLRLSTHA